jgi:tetratricopeptide (TPR) repeat protein
VAIWSLILATRHYAGDNLSTAATLTRRGRWYIDQQRSAEAEKLFQKSMGILLEKSSSGSKVRVQGMAENISYLARCYELQKRYAEAEPLYLQALDLFKKAYGENSRLFAARLETTAQFFSEIGKPDQAKIFREQAQELRIKES